MTEAIIEPSETLTIIPHEAVKEEQTAESKHHVVAPKPTSSKMLKPIKKLDAFISHLNRLMHTRDSHDALILFLAYAAHFVATALETPIPPTLTSQAITISKFILKLFPTRLSLLLSASRLSTLKATLPSYKVLIADRCRALSNILDDWQIITRLWGLLATWADAKDFIASFAVSEETEIADKKGTRRYIVEKAIRATCIAGLFGYYGLENLAWLTRRGVFKWSEKTESKLMVWSLGGWGVFILSEMAQLLYDRSEKNRTGEEDEQESRAEWKRKFVQVLLYGPLTIHWMRDGGLFPETVASFLAAYVEWLTVRGLWKDTTQI